MGSEQSQSIAQANEPINLQPNGSTTNLQQTYSRVGNRLQRGSTLPSTNRYTDEDSSSPQQSDSRPVSPPISVCSDSDLPYISYTDRPIGDSPKYRNKISVPPNRTGATRRTASMLSRRPAPSHNIVVVRPAAPRQNSTDTDPEIQRLNGIPQFLPVMRGTLMLPANRDPEIMEQLQPHHMRNMCTRMQLHYSRQAQFVSGEQSKIVAKIKEIDYESTRVLNICVERQKMYASYAEQFSKIRNISQQLGRCNVLLNQCIESMEALNEMLDVDDRLEPFVWRTEP